MISFTSFRFDFQCRYFSEPCCQVPPLTIPTFYSNDGGDSTGGQMTLGDLAVLLDLIAFAASRCDAILGSGNRLLGTAVGFHHQQVTIPA